MGAAIISVMSSLQQKKKSLEVVETNLKRKVLLRKKYKNIKFYSSIPEGWKGDVLIFAIKPQVFLKAAEGINKKSLDYNFAISIMAGLKTKYIKKNIIAKAKILRAMPNLPAIKMKSVTCCYCSSKLSIKEKKLLTGILKCLGEVYWLKKENELDAVTAISGSGPAYFFLFFQTMIEAAKKIGLDKKLASSLVIKTAYGALALAEDNKNLKKLIKNVSSKGGTTEAAMNILTKGKNDIPYILTKAIIAAKKKSISLSNTLKNE